jgi:hypothetical protein
MPAVVPYEGIIDHAYEKARSSSPHRSRSECGSNAILVQGDVEHAAWSQYPARRDIDQFTC